MSPDGDTTQRIFDKLDDHGNRLTAIETKFDTTAEENRKAHNRVEHKLVKLDTRLTDHLDMEDANMNEMRKDLHYLRGLVQGRQEERQKNPLYRLLKFLLACIGIKLP